MRFFQCATLLAVLAVSSSQYLPGGGGLLPPRKHMSDSALHKFLSAVRGGGRGHRELLSLTGSASSPSYATLHNGPGPLPGPGPAFGIGIGRLPPSVTHVPAPPKIGAFYITPPERNAPSYYGGGRRPQLVKLTELKNARPLTLIASETSNRPGGPPQQLLAQPQQTIQNLQMYTVNGPLPAGAPHGLRPQAFAGVPGGISLGHNVIQTSGPAAGSGSLQEIIAKAAQQQHAMVLAKEQKAHPNAQITSSQILVPGAGQQPVFVNQFGQQFLAPAIFGPGGQQQLLSGHPQQIQQLPPQFFSNGQGILLAQGPQFSQNAPQQKPNSVNSEVPEQLLKAQSASPQQQVPIQFLNGGGLQLPQGQAFPLIPGPQGQGFRGIPISFGQSPQQYPGGGGQIINLPPGVHPGNIAFGSPQGPFIQGNGIFGQPHFAVYGSQDLQGANKLVGNLQQQQQQQQQQQDREGADKEEQPTRPLEAASQQIESSVVPLAGQGHGHMTAAIMQSQVEFSEPIVKL